MLYTSHANSYNSYTLAVWNLVYSGSFIVITCRQCKEILKNIIGLDWINLLGWYGSSPTTFTKPILLYLYCICFFFKFTHYSFRYIIA